MRIAHLADLHLGIRQFDRTTPTGQNQREADVAATFTAAVTAVVAERPDVVVIAGDCFHVVRPSNTALVHAQAEVQRLTQALPDVPVIVVAGNHEAPRTTDTLCVLKLFEAFGVHVVHRTAERLVFPAIELSVLCVPEVAGMVRPALVPDPAARWNVLLLHGEIRGQMPGGHASALADGVYEPGELAGAWDYIALGHYHVHHQVGPKAWYAGAIDYTSTDPWREMRSEAERGQDGKGFVVQDLATTAHTFHPLPRSRRFVDLPPIEAVGMTVEDVQVAIEAETADIDGTVARLIVREVAPDVKRALPRGWLAVLRRRALNLNLVLLTPEAGLVAQGASRRRPSLEEAFAEVLMKRAQESGVDLGELVALGTTYLDAATEAELAGQKPAPLVEEQAVAAGGDSGRADAAEVAERADDDTLADLASVCCDAAVRPGHRCSRCGAPCTAECTYCHREVTVGRACRCGEPREHPRRGEW